MYVYIYTTNYINITYSCTCMTVCIYYHKLIVITLISSYKLNIIIVYIPCVNSM